MQFAKLLVRLMALVLAVPFLTYGSLGLIKNLGLERPIDHYLGLVGGYRNPVTAVILVIIGACLLYGLNALAARMR